VNDAPPPSVSRVPFSSVVGRLELELRDLWAPPAPGEPLRSRACTMNLVVVTSSLAVAERYTPVVDEVTQAIPCRAIVVTMTPSSTETSLDGEVSAVCGVDNMACSERVSIHASGAACPRVASVVDTLMVPELPTTLVWLARLHMGDPVFLELAADSQRVVLDTDYTSLSSLLALSKWAREGRSTVAVADLAWTRIAVWQDMCARFFDDEAMQPLAQGVESLRIVQMSDTGARLGAEAALLLGWLASRLGWRLEPLGGSLRFRRADGKAVSVDLGATPPHARVAPLAIASVSMRASAGGITAAGTVTRDFDGDVADVLRYKLDVNLPCSGEQTIRLGPNTGARVLERTLHRPMHDEALAAAVAFAEKLDDDGATCT